ncbi:hypothetical protein, partial [Sphingobacterium faecium]|uniref:hypothetical protein n=1 Tax=Sphingobacterium faecium TaxID=34087 RepID=UPI00188542EA
LAHYYYNSDVVYTAKDLNKYLGIKETTGKEIRIKMVHMGIITPTHLASYAKDAQGRYYRKGYDMYAGNIKDEKIKYTLLSTDARMLINKYSGEVADMLQVVIQQSNGQDVNKYIKTKDKYKNNTTDILLSATAKETILLNTSVVDIKEDISQTVEEDIMNKSLLIDDLEDLDF